ncbi:MAG TPA: hypothetical protein VFC56_02920 [Stellaceae bacterium]|nr:hypothetical protein [Stellaceae bacterium]
MRRIHIFMSSTAGRALSSLLLAIGTLSPALADFKVHLPDAETGEFELEEVGSYGRSGNNDTTNEQSFVHELGYGINNFWHAELEFETNRPGGPSNHLKFDQLTFENQFVFGERGQYWLDPGFFIEYGHGMLAGTPDETTFGPTLRKEIWGTANTVNIFFEKELGSFASGRTNFLYAWETRFETGWIVEPGFQAYGEAGPFGHFAPIGQQDHRIGPQLFTQISSLGPGTLKMNGGVLFGLTPATPRQTFRWQLEYELHF